MKINATLTATSGDTERTVQREADERIDFSAMTLAGTVAVAVTPDRVTVSLGGEIIYTGEQRPNKRTA